MKILRFELGMYLGQALFVILLGALTGDAFADGTPPPAVTGGSNAMVLLWNQVAVEALGPYPPPPAAPLV
ncbi:MAG TPA: hypothetical protein VGH59_09410, partial [Casimicrobiaceae bacterium]